MKRAASVITTGFWDHVKLEAASLVAVHGADVLCFGEHIFTGLLVALTHLLM